MASNTEKQITLTFSTLPRATKKALDFLSKQAWMEKTKWYLAGGTALAIQVGNRKSVDLDFFTQQKDFDTNNFLTYFLKNKNWKTTIQKEGTIYGELFGAKISFIAYPFFIPKQEMISYGYVKILRTLDVAVMKIIAISQRGKKRDFFDLYWCAKNVESLKNLIKKLKVQYPSVAHDYHHIIKSLVFFEDAENDPDPEIYFKSSWKKVKKFFIQEAPTIATKLFDLE